MRLGKANGIGREKERQRNGHAVISYFDNKQAYLLIPFPAS
jgi:hypothetical protein